MPELPEVEAVCRKLRNEVPGAMIRRMRMERRQDEALERKVRGATILAVERRGKNVLLPLDNRYTVRVHLRMTGNLYTIPDSRFRSATIRAWFELTDGRGLVFDDPRALGVIELHRSADIARLLAALGPEPLGLEFTPEAFITAARSSRRPAKLYLMDQSRVSGLGNIYAAEALHRAGIHPAKPMNRISSRRLQRLHAVIVEVLEIAVQSACRAYSGPGSYNSDENFPVAVYGRVGLPCPVCSRPIRRIPQGGRSTYYCPGCQR